MPFVLDTSIPACWAFQDEQDPRADAAYVRIKTEEAVVPSLWWFEIRNILVVNERRRRITESDTGVFLRAGGRRRPQARADPSPVCLRCLIPGTGTQGGDTTRNLGRRTCSRRSQGRDQTNMIGDRCNAPRYSPWQCQIILRFLKLTPAFRSLPAIPDRFPPI